MFLPYIPTTNKCYWIMHRVLNVKSSSLLRIVRKWNLTMASFHHQFNSRLININDDNTISFPCSRITYPICSLPFKNTNRLVQTSIYPKCDIKNNFLSNVPLLNFQQFSTFMFFFSVQCCCLKSRDGCAF